MYENGYMGNESWVQSAGGVLAIELTTRDVLNSFFDVGKGRVGKRGPFFTYLLTYLLSFFLYLYSVSVSVSVSASVSASAPTPVWLLLPKADRGNPPIFLL